MNIPEDPSPYFTVEKSYGDDIDEQRIASWFRDEAEAYADLGAGDASQYNYVYHALSKQHGFAQTGRAAGNKSRDAQITGEAASTTASSHGKYSASGQWHKR